MSQSYVKQMVLGSGTFGEAWLVKQSSNDRLYVMKKVQVLGLLEKERSQALSEVSILARCNHYNIIRYKESFIQDAKLSIIMEYADAGDLQSRIRQQQGSHFTTKVILDWFVQICFALRYIHGQHIIHRDLKTENIFLTSKGVIKVGDFGIARFVQNTLDLAVTSVGTPLYLSPEVCDQKPYNNKCDIWSLGCVLYELCCLLPPFRASSFTELIMHIHRASYVPLQSSRDALLIDLVEATLRVDPIQRPTADQILHIPSLQLYVDNYVNKTMKHRNKCANRSDRHPSPEVDPKISRDCNSPMRKLMRRNQPGKQANNTKKGFVSGNAPGCTNTPHSNIIVNLASQVKQADTPRPGREEKRISYVADITHHPENVDPKTSKNEQIFKKPNSPDISTDLDPCPPVLCLRVEAVKRAAGNYNHSPVKDKHMISSPPKKSHNSPGSKAAEASPKSICTETYMLQGSPKLAWKLNRYMYESACSSLNDVTEVTATLERRLQNDIGAEKLSEMCKHLQTCLDQHLSYIETIQGLPHDILDLLPCIIQLVQLKLLKQ